jgi:hypothetical protein
MESYIRSIQTAYKGYRFRSRLEARWAVYLDALGIRWDYELEGYYVNGAGYLPDFYLPDLGVWAEVKPGKFTREEFTKASLLDPGCILLDGIPDERFYFYAVSQDDKEFTAYTKDENVCSRDKDQYYTVSYRWIELLSSFSSKCLWFNTGEGIEPYRCKELSFAVNAARSARFEHGESPIIMKFGAPSLSSMAKGAEAPVAPKNWTAKEKQESVAAPEPLAWDDIPEDQVTGVKSLPGSTKRLISNVKVFCENRIKKFSREERKLFSLAIDECIYISGQDLSKDYMAVARIIDECERCYKKYVSLGSKTWDEIEINVPFITSFNNKPIHCHVKISENI